MGAMEQVDMMIDFETLGVSRDSVVLSSGIILFNKDEIVLEDYQEYSATKQIFEGQVVLPSTVAWWKRTDNQEFYRILHNGSGLTPRSVLTAFMSDLEYEVRNVWSRGGMDFDILNYHLDEEIPYWKAKDCRTLDVFQKMSSANNHNALDDCRNQVNHVRKVMQIWEKREGIQET